MRGPTRQYSLVSKGVNNIGYGEVGHFPFIWHDDELALPPEQTVEEIMTPLRDCPSAASIIRHIRLAS